MHESPSPPTTLQRDLMKLWSWKTLLFEVVFFFMISVWLDLSLWLPLWKSSCLITLEIRLDTLMFFLLYSSIILRSFFLLFWLLFFHICSSVAGAFEILGIRVELVICWRGYFGWCVSNEVKLEDKYGSKNMITREDRSLAEWKTSIWWLVSGFLHCIVLKGLAWVPVAAVHFSLPLLLPLFWWEGPRC